MEQKAIQVGVAVLTLALLLRLGSAWENGRKELGRTLIFFSSGRLVTETMPDQTQPVPTEPVEEIAAPVFGSHEEDFVRVNASWEVDTLSLLRQPLNWQLKGELPTVLILHTHGTESYEADGTYEETSPTAPWIRITTWCPWGTGWRTFWKPEGSG